jgi:hypothetical protein
MFACYFITGGRIPSTPLFLVNATFARSKAASWVKDLSDKCGIEEEPDSISLIGSLYAFPWRRVAVCTFESRLVLQNSLQYCGAYELLSFMSRV